VRERLWPGVVIAFIAGALFLGAAFALDAEGAAENAGADLLIAVVFTLSARAFVLTRNRQKYANEARKAFEPLMTCISSLDSYVSEKRNFAATWSEPVDPDSYLYELLDDWRLYAGFEPEWPPMRPDRADAEGDPPVNQAELLVTFDTLRSAYAGPDLSKDFTEVSRAAALVHDRWTEFASHYNAMEALRPDYLMPGWPVDPQVMRDFREPEKEAYRAASIPVQDAARRLEEQSAAVRGALTNLRLRLNREYEPRSLAKRSTADPFPRSLIRSGATAGVLLAAAWIDVYLLSTNAGTAITDNVLVGVSGAAAGLGLAAIATRWAERRTAQKATLPRTVLQEAIRTIMESDHPGIDLVAAEAIRAERNRIRDIVHQLQYMTPNPRLDTYSDLVTDRIDDWLSANPPDTVTTLRMTTALTQLSYLVDGLYLAG
jgi:hypothetical protein